MNSKDVGSLQRSILTGRDCFIFLIVLFLTVHWLHLGPLLITILFAYFLLDKLSIVIKRRWLTIFAFAMLVFILCLGLSYIFAQAIRTLPKIVTTSIPIIFHHAKEYGIELPFSDWDSLKDYALEGAKGQLLYIGNFANEATRQTIFVIIGVVVAGGIFVDSSVNDENHAAHKHDLYSTLGHEVIARFRSLYTSFRKVMGAQLLISAINTALTAIFVISFSFPYTILAIAITFLCGILPIIGNLISNTIIVGIGLTVSPKLAFFALIFLIILHKLEYFLNSKIIGHRIKNPVWLTLIALLVGERLLGISGMILAPVVLHFIRVETSKIEMETH